MPMLITIKQKKIYNIEKITMLKFNTQLKINQSNIFFYKIEKNK